MVAPHGQSRDRASEFAEAPRTLVLASKSPRRRQLLLEYGFEHRAIEPGVDDGLLAYPGGRISPAGWTASLAMLKARAGTVAAAKAGLHGPSLILAADTVVVHEGEVIGQPRDAADAAAIITRLADAEHAVITGIALQEITGADAAHPPRGHLLIDRATVRVGAISQRDIAAYVATGNWRGKAGGYNLRERLEAGWPIQFDGDPTSIMGLPMRRLVPLLRATLAGGAPRGWLDELPSERPRAIGDDEHLHDSAEGVFA